AGRTCGCGREHARRSQHGRLHIVQLLPLAFAGHSPGMVQVGRLPRPRRARAAQGPGRIRRDAAYRPEGQGLGFDGRGPVSCGAAALGGNPRNGRAGAGRARDPRQHDRHRPAAGARMTRVQDMGGRYGDGPVVPEPQGIVPFEADWHRRALAVVIAAGALGAWNIDTSRHARESLSPKDYARFSYYEKWIAALADLLVAKGLVSEAELAARTATPEPPHPRRLAAAAVAPMLAKGSPYLRAGAAPAFAPGDRVRARLPARNALVAGGHTRLPTYAAGQVGQV